VDTASGFKAKQVVFADILRTQPIIATVSDAALLAVTFVGCNGKRRYDSQFKRRPSRPVCKPVTEAELALGAGVDANLRRHGSSRMSNAAAPELGR
jgi:hypothetical protein